MIDHTIIPSSSANSPKIELPPLRFTVQQVRTIVTLFAYRKQDKGNPKKLFPRVAQLQETESNDTQQEKDRYLYKQETYFAISKPIAQSIHRIKERPFVVEQVAIRNSTLHPKFPNGLEYERAA